MPAKKTEPERSRYQIYRDEVRGGPPPPLQPCGTRAAAVRHQRNGEVLDNACLAALADHARDMYWKKKANLEERGIKQRPPREKRKGRIPTKKK